MRYSTVTVTKYTTTRLWVIQVNCSKVLFCEYAKQNEYHTLIWVTSYGTSADVYT